MNKCVALYPCLDIREIEEATSLSVNESVPVDVAALYEAAPDKIVTP